jgi:hypothetical protein
LQNQAYVKYSLKLKRFFRSYLMSEEIREEVKPAEAQPTSLQEKVGKLEKQLVELKDQTQAKLELLRGKVQSLHAKNMELIAKAKEQALAAKEKVVGLAPIAWIKSKFAKAKAERVKRIICYEIGAEICYMRGFINYVKAGYFQVEDAEVVTAVSGPDGEQIFERVRYLGNAVICRDNVCMWF